MSSVLTCEAVSKSFRHRGRQVAALVDVSLELQPGEFIAIRGKSGCGKSTLMLTLGGLQKPSQGRVTLAHQELYALRPDQRALFRAENIGFVFQQFHLIPYLNILENVEAAALGLPAAKKNRNGRARELIDQVGLSDRIDHRPAQLSIGECQRVAMARALLNRPRVILADEPTGNLDADNTAVLLAKLRQAADEGTAVVLVTHDAKCDEVVDRTVMMEAGKLLWDA